MPAWYVSILWLLPVAFLLFGIGTAFRSKACYWIVTLIYAIDLALSLAVGIMLGLLFAAAEAWLGVGIVGLYFVVRLVILKILLRGMSGLDKMRLYQRQAMGQ